MSAIIRKEVIGGQTIIQGDCLEVMKELGNFDALVTDPPYGIGEGGKKNSSRSKLAAVGNYKQVEWDKNTCDEHIDYARSITKTHIIFGGNYYDLPPTSCWLVWDKKNGKNDFADCELAWTNMNRAVRMIQWRWHGMLRDGDDGARVHPTQKPTGVMEWCVDFLKTETAILDPFGGSGTTAIAAYRKGKFATIIERDPDYFDIICARMNTEINKANVEGLF